MNILLIGPRACGKTTIGRLLAERLHRPFVDLDDHVLAHFPETSITEVWRKHGESAWRNAEAEALGNVIQVDGRIIALGGGVPMIPEARKRITTAQHDGAAMVIYLTCQPETLKKRLRDSPGDRPSLTGTDPVEEIPSILAVREPAYLALADRQVDTSGDDISQIIEELVRDLARISDFAQG